MAYTFVKLSNRRWPFFAHGSSSGGVILMQAGETPESFVREFGECIPMSSVSNRDQFRELDGLWGFALDRSELPP